MIDKEYERANKILKKQQRERKRIKREWDEKVEIEKARQSKQDKYYKSKGYRIERVKGRENKKQDVFLYKNGKRHKVEEKYLTRTHTEYILIETIQDSKTGCLGWLYTTEAEWVYWIMPKVIIKLYQRELLKYIHKYEDTLEIWIDRDGFGITENRKLPIDTIKKEKLGCIVKGKKVIEKAKQKRFKIYKTVKIGKH